MIEPKRFLMHYYIGARGDFLCNLLCNNKSDINGTFYSLPPPNGRIVKVHGIHNGAISTIDSFPEAITNYDDMFRLADEHNLKITISGIPSLSTYSFNSDKALEYKTFIAQEMLAKGYLASTNFYASTAHNEENLKVYFEALNDVYSIISDCEKGIKNIGELLNGPVCHGGFKRLN